MVSSLWLAAVVIFVPLVKAQELVKNGNFESRLIHDDWAYRDWSCMGCSLRIVSQSRSGQGALKVSRRHGESRGPSQMVHVKPATRYRLQAYVKQLGDVSSTMYQHYTITLSYYLVNGTNISPRKLASKTRVRSSDGWFSMISFFISPHESLMSSLAKLHHYGPDGSLDYLLDDFSLTEVAEDTNWESQANARIESIRKGNIHMRIQVPASLTSEDLTLEVDLKNHAFKFGSLVRDECIYDTSFKGYQDIVYDLFNIATLQSFKWKFDKGKQGHPDFSLAVKAMKLLKEHGLVVRGDNMFWGFENNIPDWVIPLSLLQLNRTVQERLHYMVNITKGQLFHWDVMNEFIHGQWFEERFQDPLFTQRIFRDLKALDPVPALMMNDFSVLAESDSTDDYLQLAKKYLQDGVPLEALGLESHWKTAPDPTLIRLRLDHLAQSGLPLWVTELNLEAEDENERADQYERVFRAYFSHPALQGIILWGFWDQHAISPQAALVDGPNFQFNAAGTRVAHLIKQEWHTHVQETLTSDKSLDFRGFKGDYEATVMLGGVVIKRTSFSLTGNDVTVNIALNESDVTTRGDRVIGQAAASSTSSTLVCNVRKSSPSQPFALAQVTCHTGEVLTGCSSISLNHDQHRDGELIEMVNGHPACVAENGLHGSQGVKAEATCCVARELRCSYTSAGPSFPGQGPAAQTICPSARRPLGCSARNVDSKVGGVLPTNTSCFAFDQDSKAGVHVYGACCDAPGLSCVTMTSSASGPRQGDNAHVQCDSGYVMTGCNFLSSVGTTAGATISGSAPNTICQAFNGADLDPDQTGVKAVAICCKIHESGLIG